jgi:hypothetical protein
VTAEPTAEPADTEGPQPSAPDWAVVAVLTVLGAVIAVFAIYYLPWRVGGVPLPVTALGVLAYVLWVPKVCYGLTGRLWAAAAPVIVLFGITVWMGMSRPALYWSGTVSLVDWRLYLVLGAGVLGGAWSLGSTWGEATLAAARPGGDPAAAPSGEPGHPVGGRPPGDAGRTRRAG